MDNLYELEIEYDNDRIVKKKSRSREDFDKMLLAAEEEIMDSDVIRTAVSINGEIYAEYEA